MIDAGFGRLTDPPASLLLARVRILDPAAGTDEVRDLGIVDGSIADAAAVPASAPRIDGHGLIAAPGFCDLHTHLRQPGDAAAETVASGARAAARGGYTTVCAMPNTDPPIDRPDRVRSLLDAGRDAACRVRVVGAVTVGREGMAVADLEGMAAGGAIGFSDDGASVPSAGTAGQALRALSALDRPLLEHAEDADLAAGGVMRAGRTASQLGLPGWPADAEVAVVERDLALAAETGARIHLTHLSCAASLEAVRRARTDGVRVTCDVTPHHLTMAETWVAGDRAFAWEPSRRDPSLAFDPMCRANPPLTTRKDAAALLAAIADGTIDAIATDHAPHPAERKLVPFDQAAPGLIGLETALSLGLAAVEAGVLPLAALIAALSTRPAAIIGEARGMVVGGVADLVVFDPMARWRVDRSTLASASTNTPLLGMTLPGVVRLTIADGRITYRA
ncbi:MAG TPA: dihydroorotase [Candidatus Limnocylindria bacterium]